MTLLYIVLATLAGGLLSVAIPAAVNVVVLARLVRNLVSLSTGILLGTALLQVLPEAFEGGAEPQALFATLLGGLLAFFLLEKAELYRHGHHHEGDDPHHHHHHGFDAEQAGRGGWSVLLVAAVLLGFAGVALVLRPSLDPTQFWHALAGLLSGVLAALAYLQITALGRAGEPEERTVFYFNLGSVLIGGALMAWQPLYSTLSYSFLLLLRWVQWLLGLGLINALDLRELKALLAHELGHTSRRAMGLGNYLYFASAALRQMVHGRDAFDEWLRVSRLNASSALLIGVASTSVRGTMTIRLGPRMPADISATRPSPISEPTPNRVMLSR